MKIFINFYASINKNLYILFAAQFASSRALIACSFTDCGGNVGRYNSVVN